MKVEKINLPEELFKSWLEEETATVDSLDELGVHNRIIELERIIFESNTRLSVAHTRRIKLQGADWVANSKAISQPNFKVNFDGDRRAKPKVAKQSKEEKSQQLHDAAGIDRVKLKELIKKKMALKAIAKAEADHKL